MVVATETLDKRRSSPPGGSRLDAEASSESTLCLSGRGGRGGSTSQPNPWESSSPYIARVPNILRLPLLVWRGWKEKQPVLSPSLGGVRPSLASRRRAQQLGGGPPPANGWRTSRTDHVAYHALITKLIIHLTHDCACTDHMACVHAQSCPTLCDPIN